MKPTEAAALLAICAAYDNRKPDADAAKAWSLALDGLRFEDCRDAIVQHYRTSREWIMPADVVAAVKRVRGGRIEDEAPTPPSWLDPDDTGAYQRWLADVQRHIADGEPVEGVEYMATRMLSELRPTLRALPAPVRPKPRERTAEHAARLAAARAELPAPAPIPTQEPTEGETA